MYGVWQIADRSLAFARCDPSRMNNVLRIAYVSEQLQSIPAYRDIIRPLENTLSNSPDNEPDFESQETAINAAIDDYARSHEMFREEITDFMIEYVPCGGNEEGAE